MREQATSSHLDATCSVGYGLVIEPAGGSQTTGVPVSVSKPMSSNVIQFMAPQMRATADGFRRLAEAAERGEIIGGCYTVIDAYGQTREGAFGAARSNRAIAHLGASRLASLLLWPEE